MQINMQSTCAYVVYGRPLFVLPSVWRLLLFFSCVLATFLSCTPVGAAATAAAMAQCLECSLAHVSVASQPSVNHAQGTVHYT